MLLQDAVKFCVVTFLVAGFFCGAALLDYAFTQLVSMYGEEDLAGRPIPREFPVLVVVYPNDPERREVRVMLHGQLADYLARRPEYTFQIPSGMAQLFSQELAKRNRRDRAEYNSGGLDPWYGEFEIVGTQGARQLLRVRCEWDEYWRNEGWYEASDHEIKATRYHNLRTHQVMLYFLPVVFSIMFALYVAGFRIWNRYRRQSLAE